MAMVGRGQTARLRTVFIVWNRALGLWEFLLQLLQLKQIADNLAGSLSVCYVKPKAYPSPIYILPVNIVV